MKSDRTLIIVIAAILLVLCSAASCLCGLTAGATLYLIPTRRETRVNEWSERVTPEARRVPEMMANAALVIQVYDGSPAEQAGIEVGDIILAIGGQSLKPGQDLRRLLNRFAPGDEVAVTIWDGSAEIDVEVTLGERPEGGNAPYLGLEYQMVPSPFE